MKRIALSTLLVLGIVVMVSAQDTDNRSRGQGMARGFGFWGGPQAFNRTGENRAPRISPEEVTVTGELSIVQGALAVKSGDITYLTMGLNRYIGFIDTLKDGARVTLVGNAFARSEDAKTKYLMVTKMTIAGKDYDMGPQWQIPSRPANPNRPDSPNQPRRSSEGRN